ncbi:hypothetical protein LSAT2_031284 [Lamellibrachia satsuma]|nr:hypothetical protein LSAT2_031284 [Lamellibrachia satsuma]
MGVGIVSVGTCPQADGFCKLHLKGSNLLPDLQHISLRLQEDIQKLKRKISDSTEEVKEHVTKEAKMVHDSIEDTKTIAAQLKEKVENNAILAMQHYQGIESSLKDMCDRLRENPTASCVEYPGKRNADQEEEDNQHFQMYDVVTIEEDKDRVKQLQEDRGIWVPSMALVHGLNGIVNKVNEDGNVFVEFGSGTK